MKLVHILDSYLLLSNVGFKSTYHKGRHSERYIKSTISGRKSNLGNILRQSKLPEIFYDSYLCGQEPCLTQIQNCTNLKAKQNDVWVI